MAEAREGLPVGENQVILSPFPVEFTFTGNGGDAFVLTQPDNATVGRAAQIYVNQTGGLDYETTRYYDLGITAVSNGTDINCTIKISVVDVNEKPTVLLGDPPIRNVSEAAVENSYLPGAPIGVTDPDGGDEHIFSIVH